MEVFEEIKSRVSMRELLESYGIYPVRGTNIYRCPFHDDSHPSANIHKTKSGFNNFHCFPCHLELDIFDFVEKMEHLSGNKKQVRWNCAKFINDRFNLGIIGELTNEQKLENNKIAKEHKRRKTEKEFWENFEERTLNKIIEKSKLWKVIKYNIDIKEYDYLFYYATKERERLGILYDLICDLQHPLCEYDFIYGTNKQEILKKIRNGEILI